MKRHEMLCNVLDKMMCPGSRVASEEAEQEDGAVPGTVPTVYLVWSRCWGSGLPSCWYCRPLIRCQNWFDGINKHSLTCSPFPTGCFKSQLIQPQLICIKKNSTGKFLLRTSATVPAPPTLPRLLPGQNTTHHVPTSSPAHAMLSIAIQTASTCHKNTVVTKSPSE